ncbi:MAG: hypothetical protein JWM16_2665 [Verrucomicrobiales bacterium]|nr:hypothetical protein [Verrucomicrobiales bacterium]
MSPPEADHSRMPNVRLTAQETQDPPQAFSCREELGEWKTFGFHESVSWMASEE